MVKNKNISEKINKESPAGENITINQKGWRNNGNNPSKTHAKGPNEGSNVATGASASTIAAEDGQAPGTVLNKINK